MKKDNLILLAYIVLAFLIFISAGYYFQTENPADLIVPLMLAFLMFCIPS